MLDLVTAIFLSLIKVLMQAKGANSIIMVSKSKYSTTAAEKSKATLMDNCLSINPFQWKFEVTGSLWRNSDNAILIKIPHLLACSKIVQSPITKCTLARHSWDNAMQCHMYHSAWIIISQLVSSAVSLSLNNATLSSLMLHWFSNALHYWLSEFSCCSSRVKEIHRGHIFPPQ